MLDIHAIMAALGESRPIFHSEADFQHALAWQMRVAHPDASIRLEVPAFPGSRGHVDLMVHLGGIRVPIELKYMPGHLEYTANDGEEFRLLNTDARDLPRAAFIKDIGRVETLVAEDAASIGFAIALSNMPGMWLPPRTLSTSDAAFRIHEGRILEGSLVWRLNTALTTTGGVESYTIRGRYQCRWHDYAALGHGRNRDFRYLAIEVR